MKKEYIPAELTLIELEEEDILTFSGEGDDTSEG